MYFSEPKLQQIKNLCENNGVKSLFAFGSVVRNDFSVDSDIDLVVDFEEKDPYMYANLYFDFKDSLEKLLERQIDLVEERGVKNPFFRQELDATKVKIY
ncbi:putative nucleotidyltransferase [Pedobacter sp. UYEF25]